MGESEGKIAIYSAPITLTIDPVPMDMQMLWDQTWNRKEEAVALRKTERQHILPRQTRVLLLQWIFAGIQRPVFEFWAVRVPQEAPYNGSILTGHPGIGT